MITEDRNEETIFDAVVRLRSPAERDAYLSEVCAGDAKLRAAIEELLKHHDVGSFLDVPPVDSDVTLEDSPLAEGPGTVIDKYKLLEQIGEGGMAVVYMAEQQEPIRRKVAFKIIKLGMDTRSVIARFEAERQALAMMDHPNIARVLDAGATETGRPYFVMELVTGVSITEYCDENNFSTKERLALFIQVCNAVQHAHQKGIIHRDIKPSNVMVTQHEGTPVPKVIDFGIAKATNQRLTEKTLFTRYAHIIGTPAYMSPEQAELSDVDIDTRSDIYSLGVLLYELLTGTTPFSEEELRKAGYVEMQRVIREQEPPKPSTKLSTLGETLTDIAKYRASTPDLLTKAIRGDLDWIVMKALEKDRTRRYTTASEFTADVERHLHCRPILASPPDRMYQMKKFVQRHYFGLLSGMVVTTAILLALIFSWVFHIRAEQADFDRKLSTTQQLYAEGRYEAALLEMENQGLNETRDVKARLLYAQILLDLDHRAEADSHLQGLMDAEPETAGAAHYLLARLHLGKDRQKSEEHQLLAEQILPHTADGHTLRALTSATPDKALEWLNEGLKLDPGHYASRKARALVHYGLRDYVGMLLDAEAMTAMRPKDSMGYALRALAHRETGMLEEAIFDHDRAIGLCKTERELPVLYEQRQETFWRAGDYKAALQDAQRCVALAPEIPTYQVPLGKILFELGQYEAAKEEFARAQSSQGVLWHVVKTMVQYTLDLTRSGKTLDIPDNLSGVWPFLHLQKYVDLNAQLEQKGTRLVRGACGLSSWSPDGTRLAYERSELCTWDHDSLRTRGTASPVIARGIDILDLASGHTRTLVTWGGSPAWSPDGRFIAFSHAADMADENTPEIWLIPVSEGHPRKLADGAYPTWTNENTRLYFHSRDLGALCYVDITEPTAKPIEVATCPGLYPAVSPDERHLAYATRGELTVVDLNSGKKLVEWVVPGPERFCCVQWSPDGREISMSVLGMRDYCSGLWVFDVERKQGWHLLDAEAIRCNWSRDKSLVAFDIFFPVGEIWIAHVDPNLPTWKTLEPMQTRGQYIRSHWPKYMESYGRAWSMEKKNVLDNLTAVGVNQYEYGEYEDALWTLQRVVELREDEDVGPDVKANAYVVMALQQIGRREEAIKALHRLRHTHEQAADLYDRRYLHDAEQLLANGKSKPNQTNHSNEKDY